MRKFRTINIFLMVVICASLLVSCSNDKQTSEDITISVYVPDGAPALSIANLFGNNDVEGVKLTAGIVSPTDIQAKVISGQADMAIVPLNMAANLISKGAEYKLVTVNTFGLLYLLSTSEITSFFQLGKQSIASIGKANVPQFVLDKVLESNNLTAVSDNAMDGQVEINYYASGTEIIPLLASGVINNVLLGEPAVTNAKAVCKKKGIELYEVDMQKQWQIATDSDSVGYPQAGLIVSNNIIDNYCIQFANVLNVLEENNKYLSDNLSRIGQLLSDNGSKDLSTTAFTKDLLDRCNIDCVMASAMVNEIELFLTAMSVAVPTSEWIFYE